MSTAQTQSKALTTHTAITHRYVTANGVRLHVAEAVASGPPVLLLHGYPQHWYAWRHVIADLARDHRVYALDLRGADLGDVQAHPVGGHVAVGDCGKGRQGLALCPGC